MSSTMNTPGMQARRWRQQPSTGDDDVVLPMRPLADTTNIQQKVPAQAAPQVVAPKSDAPKNDGPDLDMIRERLRTVLHPLMKHEGQYVDAAQLRNYRITYTNVNLDPSRDGSSMMPYIRPYPLQKIKEGLNVSKPWELFDNIDIDGHKRPSPNTVRSSLRDKAFYLWYIIQNYLEFDGEGLSGIMPKLTDWARVELPKTRYLRRFSYLKYDWALEGIFRPCIDYEKRTPDPEKPHVVGFVVDVAVLKEDLLSTSELTSLLYMAFYTATSRTYIPHRFLPVTMVSCSGWNMRVLQCVLDSRNGDIQIRKSRIIDFTDGILAEKNEKWFHTILSWMIGEPTGDTRGGGVW